jgi:diacylglycerol kinase (ATP)
MLNATMRATGLEDSTNQLVTEEIHNALLVVNPNAGRVRRSESKRLDRARRVLERDGIATDLALTDGPGAATGIAREAVAAGRQMVIACGGDGTFNEIVNGLAGSRVPLAVLPAGTANVLAKELALPWNIERAAALVAGSHLRRIALGLAISGDGTTPPRYFLSVSGAGPDGAIVHALDLGLKQRAGVLAYWAEGFRQLAAYRFPRFRVTAGGKQFESTLVVVGRTKHYGGPFQITTEADLYSEEFEMMVCASSSRLRYSTYVGLLCARRLRGASGLTFLKADCIYCEPLDQVPVFTQVDGEPLGRLPAEFRIVPDALTLAVPDRPTGKPRQTPAVLPGAKSG